MSGSREKQVMRLSRQLSLAGVAAVTLAFAGSLAALALAAGGAITVGTASSSTLGEQIVVATPTTPTTPSSTPGYEY
jgi:hypothetical protein